MIGLVWVLMYYYCFFSVCFIGCKYLGKYLRQSIDSVKVFGYFLIMYFSLLFKFSVDFFLSLRLSIVSLSRFPFYNCEGFFPDFSGKTNFTEKRILFVSSVNRINRLTG
jgi:hypothetical protein